MNLIKKMRKNKLNITYIIVGGAVVAMSVTNCGRKGSKHGPYYGCDDHGTRIQRSSSDTNSGSSDLSSNNLGTTNTLYTGNFPNHPSPQHREKCVDGKYDGSSWNGMSITTLNPSKRETLGITNTEVFDGFLELLGVCANTRWSGLHAQFVAGSYSCKNAIRNLKLGLNIFMDYSPEQGSYAEADAYIWDNRLTHLDHLNPWVISDGRFTRINDSRGFEIIYDLFSERSTNLKVRVEKSPEDLEDCQNAQVTVSFADRPMARGSVFLSDASCYKRR